MIILMFVGKCLTISSGVYLTSMSRSYANEFCRFGSFHRYVGYENVITMYGGTNKLVVFVKTISAILNLVASIMIYLLVIVN